MGYISPSLPPDLAYFAPCVAAKEGAADSHQFIRLKSGALIYSFFLSEEEPYRTIKGASLRLPRGSEDYFGVVDHSRQSEIEDLTRVMFGGTREEIEQLAIAYARAVGRDIGSAPRLTFSRSRSNACDLTGVLIPRQFPYLAFAPSDMDWGHVSLYGFFRLLVLQASSGRSPLRSFILDQGVDESVLNGVVGRTEHLINERILHYMRPY
ncbi:hypothetical protein ACIPRS_14800 [Pseudoxanthomonas sp. LARHCG66]